MDSFIGYASTVIRRSFQLLKESRRTLREEQERMKSVAPPPLSAGYDVPDKEVMVNDLKSRFQKNTLHY